MCIICVKHHGVAMPDLKTLRQCWTVNRDGAGMSYYKEGMENVVIAKGFMKFKRLKMALDALDFGINDIVVLHFRFATHGLVDAGNCHPFPLSNKTADLRCVYGEFKTSIAHNGVFGSMPAHDTLSDTQKFISGIMCNPAIVNNLDNEAIQELISGYCGSSSKLAILRPNKLLLLGNFVEDKGLLYSNYQYKPIVYNGAGNQWASQAWYDADYECYPSRLDYDPKACLLCEKKTDISYSEEVEAFLCKECFELNLNNNVGKSSCAC